MRALGETLAREFGHNHGTDIRSYEVIVGSIRWLLRILMGAVVLVLLIACANVANLLLASGLGRQRNLVVGRGLVLAIAGVSLGTVGAWVLIGVIQSLLHDVRRRIPAFLSRRVVVVVVSLCSRRTYLRVLRGRWIRSLR